MPQLVVYARFVYVTTYDGPSWSNNVLPEDRRAVGDVEGALRTWGKYTLVYRPEEADIILVVQKRPSEDILAVYKGKLGASSIPLWRGMKEGGLDSKELPLMTSFRKAVEAAETQNQR
jgi:hypothetical protein